MKFLILFAVIAAARAAGVLYAPAARYLETGASAQYRNQDIVGNYNFGYDEDHTTGGTSRKETGDAFGNKAGSYAIRDADGRRRVVNYVADAAGFRANVQTNEPGTAPKDPAATVINKPGLVPAVAYAAPIAAPAVAYGAALGHYGAYTGHVAAAPALAYGAALGHYGAYTKHVAGAPAVAYGAALSHYGAYTGHLAAPYYGYNHLW